MGSRLAGRLLTSPVAFLLAGFADFLVYWAGLLRGAARSRLPAGPERGRRSAVSRRSP